MENNNTEMERPLMVTITCTAYNHEAYIRQCLDGFVMQQTNFRFEAIVHDDASTDHTAEIIREYAEKYPDIIKPIYETENQYSKHDGSLQKIMADACKGKYRAMCEGDDYWTDPQKLQKQVDFMEEHPGCGLCYTDYDIYYEDENKFEYSIFHNGKHRSINFQDHLLTQGYIAPMTWMCRQDVYSKIVPYESNPDGSFAIALEFYAKSKVMYINNVTATYRVHKNSASHPVDIEKRWQYIYGLMQMQIKYAEKYSDASLVDKVYLNCYLCDILPIAIDFDKITFIEEARNYLNSKGIKGDEFISLLYKHKKQYNSILNSSSYRLGYILLTPFHWIKRMLNKTK